MNDDGTETRYLRRRVADSLAMATAAVSPCAQIAHMTLARLYGEAIDTLIARPVRPNLHLIFASAVISGRAVANDPEVLRPIVPLVLEQGKRERRAAQALLTTGRL